MKILFSDERRCSTLMEFITLKMIEYEWLIVQLPITKMVSGKNESFRKRLWFGSEFVLKMYPLRFSNFRGWDNGPRSIHQRGASSCSQVW